MGGTAWSMEMSMASGEESLRRMVEGWLAPDSTDLIRVVEFRSSRARGECYVCVEALKAEGPVAMFFFRHEDRKWYVYPSERKQPSINWQLITRTALSSLSAEWG
jgi:hypothetical protein